METINTGNNCERRWIFLLYGIDKVKKLQPPKQQILDLDSSVNKTLVQQECPVEQEHFAYTCHQALLLTGQFGNLSHGQFSRAAITPARDSVGN